MDHLGNFLGRNHPPQRDQPVPLPLHLVIRQVLRFCLRCNDAPYSLAVDDPGMMALTSPPPGLASIANDFIGPTNAHFDAE
ncbi:hypothetical protein [Bradyrhizobium sp. CCGB20]|uniref:hypothetical protein n=1 Tax=Bradyrhizobium sp. CCGB20 TaxID=2949633 RepID=UPI0020B1DB32|nr:hypothetical protein [Bradyrhizobium sp. CCGB20]MCP3396932.1 hypothetical protein [Bradyrhizobium sp. CCGB20]